MGWVGGDLLEFVVCCCQRGFTRAFTLYNVHSTNPTAPYAKQCVPDINFV